MAEWPSDDDVSAAADRLSSKLHQLPDKPSLLGEIVSPAGEAVRAMLSEMIKALVADAVKQLESDVQDFVALDPQRLVDQHDLAQQAAKMVDSETSNDYIDVVCRAVGDWQGEAAEAFKTHVGRFAPFVDDQRKYIEDAQKSLIAAYKLAVLSRRDFIALAEATIAAVDRYLGARSDRQTSVALKIAGGVVSGVLSAASGGLVGIGLAVGAAAITGGIEAYTAELAADKPEAVISAYRNALTRIRDTLRQDLDTLAKYNDKRRNDVEGAPPRLFDPLPSSVDVDSPDFSYERFFSEWENSPHFPELVEQERKRIAEPADVVRADSLITRALDGG